MMVNASINYLVEPGTASVNLRVPFKI